MFAATFEYIQIELLYSCTVIEKVVADSLSLSMSYQTNHDCSIYIINSVYRDVSMGFDEVFKNIILDL